MKKGCLKEKSLRTDSTILVSTEMPMSHNGWRKKNAFYYMRSKFGDIFPEKIYHPEDDNGHDLFIPFKKVDPSDPEIIKKEKTESFVLKKRDF